MLATAVDGTGLIPDQLKGGRWIVKTSHLGPYRLSYKHTLLRFLVLLGLLEVQFCFKNSGSDFSKTSRNPIAKQKPKI